MSRPAFRSTVAALAATAALTVAGCGVDASDSAVSAVEPGGLEISEGTFEGTGGAVFLNRAAEATAAVDTQRMSMTMETRGAPMGGDLTMTAEGEFDNGAGLGAMTMDLGGAFDDMEGAGLPAGASTMEMVLDGETVYLKSPLYSMFADGDTEWVSVPAEELDADAGFGTGAEDPGAFLEFLQRAGGEVTEVGTEEVRGVETVHVRTELDLMAILEEADPDERAELEQALEGMGEGVDAFRTLPTEAWIDEDGYVRRFTMTFDFSELGGSDMGDMGDMGDLSMTMTIELYDFGEPVSITVPDPADVSSLDPSILDGGF